MSGEPAGKLRVWAKDLEEAGMYMLAEKLCSLADYLEVHQPATTPDRRSHNKQ